MCICVKDECSIDPFNALASCHTHSCSLIASCSYRLAHVRHGEITLALKTTRKLLRSLPSTRLLAPASCFIFLSGCGSDDAPGPAGFIPLLPHTQEESVRRKASASIVSLKRLHQLQNEGAAVKCLCLLINLLTHHDNKPLCAAVIVFFYYTSCVLLLPVPPAVRYR